MDPLAGSPWSAPGTVAGFAKSAPNPVLMSFAATELHRCEAARALDIGCGAGRNVARLGWHVVGTDLSWPMLTAAATRAHELIGIVALTDLLNARALNLDAEQRWERVLGAHIQIPFGKPRRLA